MTQGPVAGNITAIPSPKSRRKATSAANPGESSINTPAAIRNQEQGVGPLDADAAGQYPGRDPRRWLG